MTTTKTVKLKPTKMKAITTLPNITIENAYDKSIELMNTRKCIRLTYCEKSEADFSIEDGVLSDIDVDRIYLKVGGKSTETFFVCEIVGEYYELNFYKKNGGKVRRMANMELQKIN